MTLRKKPLSLRDYLQLYVPRATTTEMRIALERLLIAAVAHQRIWAERQRGAADELHTRHGHCAMCSRQRNSGRFSEMVPIQMVDAVLASLMADDGILETLTLLGSMGRSAGRRRSLRHLSVSDYCRTRVAEGLPGGYVTALYHGMRDLMWDLDEVTYPVWVLDGFSAIFMNKCPSGLRYTWRALLPRLPDMRVHCSVPASSLVLHQD